MMTATEYRACLASIGLTQVGAGEFFGVNPRTSRRWAAETGEQAQDVPRAVEMVLRIMIARGVSVADVQIMMSTDAA